MASAMQFGKTIPPQQLILLYSANEWEGFAHEWIHCKKIAYKSVVRFSGSGDMGIDVAGFADDNHLSGIWDNYQCKHYDSALTPSVASAEIAKILWYTFQAAYATPRAYYFVAPKDCGMKLKRLLLDPAALKKHVRDNWATQCAGAVTTGQTIQLNGAFADHVDKFDFSIFHGYPTLTLIDEHKQTPYHAARFGGGLKPRLRPIPPGPVTPAEVGQRYVAQLLEAYGDRLKTNVPDINGLQAHPNMVQHFHRQREFFYHAESLRNFARDTVPPGTFEDLQSEVHAGVIDVEAADHADALARCDEVSKMAVTLSLTANALISTLMVQDRKGICHQLADDDRLQWKKP